jgi:hypothetical protein
LHAILFESCPELLRGHLVTGGNSPDCLIQLGIVDLEAGFAGILQLNPFHDQALQHLTLEFLLRRQRRTLLLQLLEGSGQAGAQIEISDDIIADNSHDAISLDNGLWRGRHWMRQQAAKTADQDNQVTNKWVHGLH